MSDNFRTVRPYLLFWLLLNLVQASLTELIHDESYYWYYAQDLDWGYFDHPPAVAWMAYLGGLLFHNELGVRLLTVLSSTATLWLIWKTIDDKPGGDPKLFFALVFSSVIIHVGGFITVPDIPLVFFAALFFYFFKQYLEKDSWWTALWLALSVLGMAYSKYQGALVVLFAMLPNLRLLRRPSLWMIPVLVLVLYLPHFFWQQAHDFQTFRYQFVDRSNVPYKFEFFLSYLLGQVLIFGPLVGFLLFPAVVRFRSRHDFDRTMKWSAYGFFGFFLLQSLQGRVEPNWTVMAAVPVFYLAYFYSKDREKQRRLAMRLAVPSLVLVLIFRLYMMWDFLPPGLVKRNEFHGWDVWAQRIADRAGDLPVVFHNTFQKPSKYMFYSGKFAHAANYVDYAGKEYDLKTATEEALQGKTVFRIHGGGADSLDAGGQVVKFDVVPNFQYFNRVKIQVPQGEYVVSPDTVLQVPIIIENPTAHDIDFSTFDEGQLSLDFCIFWYGMVKGCEPAVQVFPVKMLKAGEKTTCLANIYAPAERGDGDHWQFRFSIRNNEFRGRNCDFIHLKVR